MKIYEAMAAAALTAGLCFAQQGPTPQPEQVEAEAANVQGVYGKIKDVKAGDKIVIEVEKGRDRTYSLADPKKTISVADGLAIGDKVKIVESGRRSNKSIQIVRDVRDGSGESGERSRTGEQQK